MFKLKVFILEVLILTIVSGNVKAYYSNDIDFNKYCFVSVISSQCNDYGLNTTIGQCSATILIKDRYTAESQEHQITIYKSGAWSSEDAKTLSYLAYPVGPFTTTASSIAKAAAENSAQSELDEILNSYEESYGCH
jgi:hypothetical protein